MHYIKYQLSKEYLCLIHAKFEYLLNYTKYINNLINPDLIITKDNIRILLYNIYMEKITTDNIANSNYFNSFNNLENNENNKKDLKISDQEIQDFLLEQCNKEYIEQKKKKKFPKKWK